MNPSVACRTAEFRTLMLLLARLPAVPTVDACADCASKCMWESSEELRVPEPEPRRFRELARRTMVATVRQQSALASESRVILWERAEGRGVKVTSGVIRGYVSSYEWSGKYRIDVVVNFLLVRILASKILHCLLIQVNNLLRKYVLLRDDT